MHLFEFLLNPLMGFISAMKDLNRRYAGLVYVAFFALFGFAISFNLETADSYRIGARFCQNTYASDMIWEMYMEGSLTDVYLIFVYSILKPFTNNPKVLFGVLGAFMGMFSFLSVRQIYEIWEAPKNKYLYIIAFCYFLAVSFFNVNGIRFWTATAWFSYFVIRYLYFDKKRALIGVILTPLFHFGYLIPVIALVAFFLLKAMSGNRTRLFFFFMFFSFCASVLTPSSFVGDMLSDEEETFVTGSNAIDRKVGNYTKTTENQEKEKKRAENRNTSLYRKANSIYTKTFTFVNKIGLFILLCTLYKKQKSLFFSNRDKTFFNYALFMFGVGSLATMLIGSGGRFVVLANMLITFYLAIIYQKNQTPAIKRSIKWLIPINLYSISFLIINSPRLVTWIFWVAPFPLTIINGIGFGAIDFVSH